MKALVTGGNGFIGSHLVDALLTAGWQVTVLDLYERRFDPLPVGVRFIATNLGETYLLREALLGVDVVFHLAWATIHETANQDPVADINTNLIPTVHLFRACLDAGVQRVVFVSSGGTVYGLPHQLPIPESHPTHPLNAYGITKLAAEKYLQMLGALYGLDYIILRPSVPYGERQNPLGRQGVISVFMYRIAHGLPITIWGDGEISRDFFHVEEMARAMLLAAQVPLSAARVFNLGGGVGTSLNTLISAIESTVAREAQVTYTPARAFDVPQLLLDIRQAEAVMGWKPELALALGLQRTWNWMQKTITPLTIGST